MPIDVTKTRLETLSGRVVSKGSSLLCVYHIFMDEGIKKLFSGTMARLVRVTASSMVMFSFYNYAFKYTAFIDEGKYENKPT